MESRTDRPLKLAFVGAGNVAWGLARALTVGGKAEVVRVVARHHDSAESLAEALGPDVEATTDIRRAAEGGVDIVVVAASDSAIADIAHAAGFSDAIWVHTSGSVEAETLAPASKLYGVFYPMQTFTRGLDVDLADSPIYIEASSPEVDAILVELAESISRRVRHADSEGRRRLHCAAVFACNFTNHLWHIADTVAQTAGGAIDDYFPLIEETLRKAREIGPRAGQTGPARRGATSVTSAHEALLQGHQREIYHLLTQSISATYEQD